MQDFASQFFFVSAGVGVWVGVIILIIVGVLLVRMLSKFNHVADEVKQTVDDVANIKSRFGDILSNIVSTLLDSKKKSIRRGGVSRGRKQKRR